MRRTSLRDLSLTLNINKTSLIRLLKGQVIKRHTNAIKSFLKEENMVTLWRFCLIMIESGSTPRDVSFKSTHNLVHIDEKWLYDQKVRQLLHATRRGRVIEYY